MDEGSSSLVGRILRDITGPTITGGALRMAAADLGIMRKDPDRHAIAIMFGDNFEFEGLNGTWRSPSVVMYDDNHKPIGIPGPHGSIEAGPVKQLWPYEHDNPEFSTVLPCDFIKVGEWWHVAAMVTNGLCNELRTEFWRSRDLILWEYEFALFHPGHPGNINLTFEQIGPDWVYIMGTGGLRRDRGIWLWRNKINEFPRGWWEPFGHNATTGAWAWGTANECSPVLSGCIGEINLRLVGKTPVLSYFNAGRKCMTARRAHSVTGPWWPKDDYILAGPDDSNHISYLYGGYISPLSKLDVPYGMKYAVSQWNTNPAAGNKPYKVILCESTL